MSQEFINNEIKKIIDDKEFNYPRNMAMAAAWVLGNLKGINLKVFDVSHTSSLSDYYVLASATNTTQANAMASEIVRCLRNHELNFLSKEGVNGSDWILLDAGDIIIHIFLETAREIYGLEELWTDAKSVSIPQSYYFSSEDAEAAGKLDDKGRDFF
ncbi:MAG: ribosome silencing factor [Bacteriovoracaceae bacterium]|nr:ribosome silencing factor [Bacteriovoracaceae bacterium]